MFIELTDHLRCPADHEEQYLVLLPDVVVKRSVQSGSLGCPICGRTVEIRAGVAHFRGTASAATVGAAEPAGAPLPAEALQAFLGIDGPGGYVALVGDAAVRWHDLSEILPGVAMVAIDPRGPLRGQEPVLSVLEADRIPLKARTMRAVVLGAGHGDDAAWIGEALRTVLPGRRVVGQGRAPTVAGLRLLGAADGWWVAEAA